MTDAPTATRIKATRVRQTERIIRDLGDSGTTNPSSSSGSGQLKGVRFSDQDLEPKPDTEMQTGGQEAPVTRKRSAETDAERLEEETAETAKAHADKRIALKRKAENDLGDSEVADCAVNPLAELWHREDGPDSEVYLLIFQQRDRYVASVHETGGDKPVCEEPKTLFSCDECGWDCIEDTSGKFLNNTLVEKARAEKISVIRELRSCLSRKVFVELPERAQHGQEQSWTFAQEHVRLPRRWSELGIRDLPSHDCNLAFCRVEHHRASTDFWKSSSSVWVHGDDFVLLGYIVSVRWFLVKLQEFWVDTNRGILGPPGYHNSVQSNRLLGRIVEWTVDGITWEADPRHAELMRKSLGVTGRSVTTPGVRD